MGSSDEEKLNFNVKSLSSGDGYKNSVKARDGEANLLLFLKMHNKVLLDNKKHSDYMFRNIIRKLDLAIEEYDSTVKNIIKQNQDLEELSEELLGERMSDEIMERVIEQEIMAALKKRIKEAFD